MDEGSEATKQFYLILHDVSKKNNCGTLLRSASAFGCSGVVVQARRRADITTFGAHGADKHLRYYFVVGQHHPSNGDNRSVEASVANGKPGTSSSSTSMEGGLTSSKTSSETRGENDRPKENPISSSPAGNKEQSSTSSKPSTEAKDLKPSSVTTTTADLFTFAKQDLKCHVVGIEIRDDAINVCSDKFMQLVSKYDRIAFVLGNEGSGLSPSAAARCDDFVYIPHHGGGTASLNVAVAGSIVFHRFADCAHFQERERQGEKFVVEQLSKEQRQMLNEDEAKIKREARAKRLVKDEDDLGVGALGEEDDDDDQEE